MDFCSILHGLQIAEYSQIISDVIDHIQNCSLKKFNYLDPTYTIERILNDVKMIVNSIQFFLSGFLSNTLIFLFCFYVILTKVPIIAICQLILIVTYYFIFKYIRPLLIEVSVRLKEESAHLISNLQNQIKNIKFIKAYNKSNFMIFLLLYVKWE